MSRLSGKSWRISIAAGIIFCSVAAPITFANEGVPAPDFSEHDIRGEIQSLAKYEGSPIVLYFWATWCAWCRKDVKNVQEMYSRFYPKGVVFISVSLDQDLSQLENFVETNGIHYPVLFDGQGWQNKMAQLYGVHSTPHLLILGREHTVQQQGGDIAKLPKYLESLKLLKN